MKKLLLLLMALEISLPLVFAIGHKETAEEFVVWNGAEPETLDPHLISSPSGQRISLALFEGLLAYDPQTGQGIPGLAESWEISKDGKVYTFNLRRAGWSDGVAITAETVVRSWLRILKPEFVSPNAWLPVMLIKGAQAYNSGEAGPEAVKIRALDEYTFQMELIKPCPYITSALPHLSFSVVPLHAIEQYGPDWTRPENFVGNGPFVLEEWKPGSRLTLVRNHNYWEREAAALDRINYIHSDDSSLGFEMYLKGKVDWVIDVPLDRIESARQQEDYHTGPQLAVYYYIFNTQKPPFDDAKVRRALSQALDHEELVETVAGRGEIPAYSLVPPMVGYEGITANPMNIEKARQLLAEAGYPEAVGFPGIQILFSTSELQREIGVYFQQQCNENLGLGCELDRQEMRTYMKRRRAGDFQIAFAGWSADYADPSVFLDMFVTGAEMNHGRYSNTEYDRLLSEASVMEAGLKRMTIFKSAEEILINQDQAILPIFFYANRNMIDTDKWGGWHPNVLDVHPPKNIYHK